MRIRLRDEEEERSLVGGGYIVCGSRKKGQARVKGFGSGNPPMSVMERCEEIRTWPSIMHGDHYQDCLISIFTRGLALLPAS